MSDGIREYDELLAQERAAWHKLRASRVGNQYDPELLAEWLACGRRCAAARNAALDQVLHDDPGVMHRPLPDA
jgi:hypothetical protein